MSNVPDSGAAGSPGWLDPVITRFHLPDDWSGKGACPVCRAPGQLYVRHQTDLPDQMVCGACGTTLEVEASGSRIHVLIAPAALAGVAGVLDAWLTPSELRARIDQATPTRVASPFEQSESPTPAADAANARPTPAAAKATTSPLAHKSSNAAAEREVGTEDLLARLSAVIGGLSPAAQPSDAVLADELERVLMARSAPGGNGAAGAAENAPADDASATTLPIGWDEVPPNLAPPAGASAPTLATAAANASQAQPSPAGAPSPASPATIASASDSQTLAPAATMAAPAQPGPNRHELGERAWKLHELGNSLASIQGALESSGGAPEDVAAIMAKLVALEQARRARFRHSLEITLGVALAVLVVALVLGALVTRTPASEVTPSPAVTLAGSAAPTTGAAQAATAVPGGAANPTPMLRYNPLVGLINQVLPDAVKIANGPLPTLSEADLATADARKSGLPGWVSTLVPSSLTLQNAPTPSLDSSGPAYSPCPSTPDQASALFGGPAANWSFSRQQQAWIFVLSGNPVDIRVPANMTAGYLVVGQSLEMRSSAGPATIHNVNFVAIRCS